MLYGALVPRQTESIDQGWAQVSACLTSPCTLLLLVGPCLGITVSKHQDSWVESPRLIREPSKCRFPGITPQTWISGSGFGPGIWTLRSWAPWFLLLRFWELLDSYLWPLGIPPLHLFPIHAAGSTGLWGWQLRWEWRQLEVKEKQTWKVSLPALQKDTIISGKLRGLQNNPQRWRLTEGLTALLSNVKLASTSFSSL